MRETHKEQKLRDQRRTGELENAEVTEEAREALERKPYTVCDFLRKVGVDLEGDVAGGEEKIKPVQKPKERIGIN